MAHAHTHYLGLGHSSALQGWSNISWLTGYKSPSHPTCRPVLCPKRVKPTGWEIVDLLLAQEQGYPLRGQGQANSGSHEVYTGPYLACG